MATVELRAIAGADHMISPEADKHDFDGWYRARIRELLAYIEVLEAQLQAKSAPDA